MWSKFTKLNETLGTSMLIFILHHGYDNSHRFKPGGAVVYFA